MEGEVRLVEEGEPTERLQLARKSRALRTEKHLKQASLGEPPMIPRNPRRATYLLRAQLPKKGGLARRRPTSQDSSGSREMSALQGDPMPPGMERDP